MEVGPEEKFTVKKPKNQNYLGPNLGQALELFEKLERTPRYVGYTRVEKSSKNFKGSSQFSKLPNPSSALTFDNQISFKP